MIVRHWRGLRTTDPPPLPISTTCEPRRSRNCEQSTVTAAHTYPRETGDAVEFVVLALWNSLESVRAFAGDDYEAAVVPPKARSLLVSFDERALHYDVAIGPESATSEADGA